MGAFDHLFGPGRGEFEKKCFQKFKCPGGMLKLRFDWYITVDSVVLDRLGETISANHPSLSHLNRFAAQKINTQGL